MKASRKVGFAALIGFISWISIDYALFNDTLPPMEEAVKRHGYPLEIHEVQTEDGFILTIHRIPHGRGQVKSKRPPVLLQHGAGSCSYNFVGLAPESSLGYLLADRGYDVWMGNCRGNTYSLKHASYSPSDDKFWDHSWHEIGIYDVPVIIDYVLNSTGHSKLSYIGHSMGSTVLAVLLSTKPEYNSKIHTFFALAPAIRVPKVDCLLMKFLGVYYGPIALKVFGNQSWFSWIEGLRAGIRRLCHPHGLFSYLCVLLYQDFGASTQFRQNELHEVFSTIMSSGSLKVATHFGQIYTNDKFQQVVYGSSANKEIYGVEDPPEYNLKMITVPTVLIYSNSDSAISQEGVEHLGQQLPNASLYQVPHDKFNHLDFIYGRDVVDLVYNKIFRILEKTNSKEKEWL